MTLQSDDPLAVEVCEAIRSGDVERLQRLLASNPGLVDARITPAGCADGSRRTLLHIATDWPGHLPNVAATIGALVDAGADVNARFAGPHTETALHWAASSDDLEALDALLDAGADIEAGGAVIGGGTPLADAVAFGQWQAARRLIERGAQASLWQAAALGLMATVEEHLAHDPAPPPDDITNAFWCACHGGQLAAAQRMLVRGAELNWVGHDGLTPLDAAARSGADEVVAWLRGHGARSARNEKEDKMAIHAAEPLDVVVGWMDAMRRGALDDVERCLDPDVTWRGVRDSAVCRNRDEVLDMLQGSLEGRLGADAVEVIAGEGAAVLGAKVPGLAEIGGVDVRGQLFNVFRVGCGRIIAVEDYAHRDEALAAAGAKAPQWA